METKRGWEVIRKVSDMMATANMAAGCFFVTVYRSLRHDVRGVAAIAFCLCAAMIWSAVWAEAKKRSKKK